MGYNGNNRDCNEASKIEIGYLKKTYEARPRHGVTSNHGNCRGCVIGARPRRRLFGPNKSLILKVRQFNFRYFALYCCSCFADTATAMWGKETGLFACRRVTYSRTHALTHCATCTMQCVLIASSVGGATNYNFLFSGSKLQKLDWNFHVYVK